MTEQAKAITEVAQALRDLGNGNAATSMGAIENLAVKVEAAGVSTNLGLLAVAESLQAIADAIIYCKEGTKPD